MPIQFRCAQCGQPIEVDDEHAGRAAACPFCRHVVAVPAESTYGPTDVVTARGVAPVPQGGAAAAGSSPPLAAGPTPAQRAAQNYGSYALVFTLIGALLLGGAALFGAVAIMRQYGVTGAASLGPADREKIEALAAQYPWLMPAQCGGVFFALVGLVLGIVSLTRSVAGNWRGVVSTALSALMMLCVCVSSAMSVALMGAG